MSAVNVLLVSQFFFSDDDILHKPINLTLHLLSILGCVAQAYTCNVTQVLGRKLELVDVSSKKRGR